MVSRIRTATLRDSGAISGLLQMAFAEFEHLYTPLGYAATVLPPEEVVIRMGMATTFVLEQQGVIVATASSKIESDALHVLGMAVNPRVRRQGLARKLLGHLESVAVDSGVAKVTLSTTPFLLDAIRLYEKFGFQRVTGSDHDLFGTPLFDMEMQVSC